MSEHETTAKLLFFAKGEHGPAAAAPTAGKVRPEVVLIERISAGDEEAFSQFYKLFAPMVHGIILARVPRAEVDDLVQEVFLLAHKNLPALREKAAVGAWLAMIARNCAAAFYRQARSTEELTEDMSTDDHSQKEAREILAAIRDLPDTYRETLVLRLVEGLTGQEIAEKTGLTPESVRVNLHRGMKLLRQKLGLKE